MVFKQSIKRIKKELGRNKHFKNFSYDGDGYSFYVSSSADVCADPHEFDGELKEILNKYGFETWGGGCAIEPGAVYDYHCGPNLRMFRKIIKKVRKAVIDDFKDKVLGMTDDGVIEEFLKTRSEKELDKFLSFQNDK